MQKKKVILIVLVVILLITFLVFFLFRKGDNTLVPSDATSDISSPNTDEGIKELFQKYLGENFTEKDAGQVKYFQITDSQNRTVPLDKFADKIGLIIRPSVATLISNNKYSLFYCYQGREKTYGITLGVKMSSDHDNYVEIAQAMKDWEPTLFHDTKSVIFPNITGPTFDSTNANIEFKEGEFRYADINMPDGSKKSINYYINSSAIFISSSRECLYSTFPDIGE